MKRKISTPEKAQAITQGAISVNSDRTVNLTFATATPVLRNSMFEGPFYEILSMEDPSAIDFSRMQSAPLLDSHDQSSVHSIIGSIEKTWIENKECKAKVRFPKDDDSILKLVQDKIIKNVSVGYRVLRYKDVSKPGDSIPTLLATSWMPLEVSLCGVPADPNSQIRSNKNLINPTVEIEILDTYNKGNNMPQDTKDAVAKEKERQAEIRTAVRSAKFDETYADELCSQDISSDQARKLVLEKLSSSEPAPIQNHVRVEIGSTSQEKARSDFESALLYKINRNCEPTQGARSFLGMSAIRMTEAFIGRRLGESDVALSRRAMSSSDMPLALANVAEKSLQKQYELAPKTFQEWTRPDTLRNYKEFSQVKSGDFGSLLERPEGAEFKMSYLSEANEVAKLKDYGIIHAFTSQMLVNDDLSALSRLASSGGIAAARLEEREAYSALTTNKTMKDGVALYNSSHGNLGTAGSVGATTVAEAFKLMRAQKSTDSRDYLNLYPSIFVCGPDKEHEAKSFFAPINAQQTSNVNIYSGSMKVIVSPEITGNQYYFLCDPNLIDTVVCFRLEGLESPVVESRVDFNTSSLQLKCSHAFAAAPMDFRGMIKNSGN